ncbi:hypothetical protein HELRODRAFT_170022 [Helobdella robusta]|uniref:Uncharacterized protein n=1 Tax=Helobdella robusta TaxID=6412 RepID=T1F2J7_HELRO|nr:hypothetical protein HELRODRAFT_170022 [Helobdella robusta]ESO07489.1 hypothetical protein HELRODRAFT_170022 [Helobdella robusta]
MTYLALSYQTMQYHITLNYITTHHIKTNHIPSHDITSQLAHMKHRNLQLLHCICCFNNVCAEHINNGISCCSLSRNKAQHELTNELLMARKEAHDVLSGALFPAEIHQMT